GLVPLARLAPSLPELLDAEESIGLAEHHPFPLARLVGVVFPAHLRVLRRVVAAVPDGFADAVGDASDHAAIDREAEDRREVALRDAVGRIDPRGLAELRD